MACKHERIKSVNCVIFCDICGEKLPVDFLVGKDRIAEQKQAEPQTQEAAPARKRATTKKGGK